MAIRTNSKLWQKFIAGAGVFFLFMSTSPPTAWGATGSLPPSINPSPHSGQPYQPPLQAAHAITPAGGTRGHVGYTGSNVLTHSSLDSLAGSSTALVLTNGSTAGSGLKLGGSGFDLDLASSSPDIVLGKTSLGGAPSVVISVGGVQKTYSAGAGVTAAEYVAIKEVLSGGQTIVLGSNGAAVGGAFNLNSVVTSKVTELVIPAGVTGVDYVSTNKQLTVGGDLLNYGSLYGLSSNSSVTSGGISAKDITNEVGGIISTVLPASLLSSSAVPALTLTLTAIDDITNAGVISSSGGLSLVTGSGNLTNTGTISAQTGNINIATASPSTNLNINAIGGTFQALNGNINVRDSAYAGSANINMIGGNYLSQNLNIYAGNGNLTGVVGTVTGNLNSTANGGHFLADTSSLTLGDITDTGDPTYASTGNINLTGNINAGQSIAILSGGNISIPSLANVSITTSGTGGSVTLVAGATVTINNGGSSTGSVPPGTDITNGGTVPTATATVSFASGSGGNIDLHSNNSNSGTVIDTSASTQLRRNVVLVAYANGTTGGDVWVNSINTSNTNGSGGDVHIIAGGDPSSPGATVTVGNITTTGSLGNKSGEVTIFTEQPAASASSASNQVVYDAAGGLTGTASIVPSGGIITNGQVTTGTITAGGGAGDGGNVIIAAGQVNTITAINASGSNGGNVIVNGLTGVTLGNIDTHATNAASGIGGAVVAWTGSSATSGATLTAGTIDTHGASGGEVQLVNSSPYTASTNLTVGTITTSASGVNGTAGPVSLVATGAISAQNITATALNASSTSATAGGVFISSGGTGTPAITVGNINSTAVQNGNNNYGGTIILLSAVTGSSTTAPSNITNGSLTTGGDIANAPFVYGLAGASTTVPNNLNIEPTSGINILPGGYQTSQSVGYIYVYASDRTLAPAINFGASGTSLDVANYIYTNGGLFTSSNFTINSYISSYNNWSSLGLFSSGSITGTGGSAYMNITVPGTVLVAAFGATGLTVGQNESVNVNAGQDVVLAGNAAANFSLVAGNSISTGQLNASGPNSGGSVDLTATDGFVSTGAIYTNGGLYSSGAVNITAANSIFTDGIDTHSTNLNYGSGSINLTGTIGSVTTGMLDASSTNAYASSINITAGTAVQTGVINAFASTGASGVVINAGSFIITGNIEEYSSTSQSGAVTLTAGTGFITTGNIDTHNDYNYASGNNVTLTAGQSITVGNITADENAQYGYGAGISIVSGGSVNAGTISALSGDYGNQAGGGVQVSAATGSITTGSITDATNGSATNNSYSTGPITLSAATSVNTGAINSSMGYTGNGVAAGTISVSAGTSLTTGTINSSTLLVNGSGYTYGDSGAVNLSAAGAVSTGAITSSTKGEGAGAVTIYGATVSVGGNIDSSSSTPNALGVGNAGGITVIAQGATTVSGTITSNSANYIGGSLTIQTAGAINTGNINASSGGTSNSDTAGSVSLTGSQVTTGTVTTSAVGGNGGNIVLVAGTSTITTGALDAHVSNGSGSVQAGSVSLVALGAITNGDTSITASSKGNSATVAGDIFVSSGATTSPVTVGALDTSVSNASSGAAGNIFLGGNEVSFAPTFSVGSAYSGIATPPPTVFNGPGTTPISITNDTVLIVTPGNVTIAPGVYSHIGTSGNPVSLTLNLGGDSRLLVPIVTSATGGANLSNFVADNIVGGTLGYQLNGYQINLISIGAAGISISGTVSSNAFSGGNEGVAAITALGTGAITRAGVENIITSSVQLLTTGGNIGSVSQPIATTASTITANALVSSSASVFLSDTSTGNVTLSGVNSAGSSGTFYIQAANASGTALLSGPSSSIQAGSLVLQSISGNVGSSSSLPSSAIQLGVSGVTNVTAEADNGSVYLTGNSLNFQNNPTTSTVNNAGSYFFAQTTDGGITETAGSIGAANLELAARNGSVGGNGNIGSLGQLLSTTAPNLTVYATSIHGASAFVMDTSASGVTLVTDSNTGNTNYAQGTYYLVATNSINTAPGITFSPSNLVLHTINGNIGSNTGGFSTALSTGSNSETFQADNGSVYVNATSSMYLQASPVDSTANRAAVNFFINVPISSISSDSFGIQAPNVLIHSISSISTVNLSGPGPTNATFQSDESSVNVVSAGPVVLTNTTFGGTTYSNSTPASTFALTTTTGNITQSNSSIQCTNLNLTASAGSIGTSQNNIQTNASTVSVNATGSVYVTDSGSMSVTGGAGPTSVFSLFAGGTISSSGSLSGGTVALGATAGTIGMPGDVGAGPIQINAPNLTLNYSGGFGVFVSSNNNLQLTVAPQSGSLFVTSGGDITTTGNISITNGFVSLISTGNLNLGTASVTSGATVAGAPSGIILAGSSSVTTGAINASGITGGTVMISGPNGITTGNIDTHATGTSSGDNGGSVVVLSGYANSATISVGSVNTSGQNGGLVELVNSASTSATTNLTVSGNITADALGVNGLAGPVALVASGAISAQNISARATAAASTAGFGGGVFISSGGTGATAITVGNIDTSALGTNGAGNTGGNIILLSSQPAISVISPANIAAGSLTVGGVTPGIAFVYGLANAPSSIPATLNVTPTTSINIMPGGYQNGQSPAGTVTIESGGFSQTIAPITSAQYFYFNGINQADSHDTINIVAAGYIGSLGTISTTSSTGSIGIFAANGAITLTGNQNLNSNSDVLIASFFGGGISGVQNVTATSGRNIVVVGDLNLGYSNALSGSVSLNAAGLIKLDNVSSYTYDAPAPAGSVTLTAGQSITTNGNLMLWSDSTSSAGSVSMTAGSSIIAGYIEAYNESGTTGNSGSISLSAGSGITMGNLYTYGYGSGVSGAVSATAAGGALNINGNIDTHAASGAGGTVMLSAAGSVAITGEVTSYGSLSGGSVQITATGGSIGVLDGGISSNSGSGPGGLISLVAGTSVLVSGGTLATNGASGGGSVQITASGGSITTWDIVASANSSGNAGIVTLNAGSAINIGNVTTGAAGNISLSSGASITAISFDSNTASNGNSGNISVVATTGITVTGSITTENQSYVGNAGSVTLVGGNGGSVSIPSVEAFVNSSGQGNGGSVTISAGGAITVTNAIDTVYYGSSGGPFNGGTVQLTAGSGITLGTSGQFGGAINSYANSYSAAAAGNGGSVTIISGGSVYVPGIDSYSEQQSSGGNGGNGGNITITAAGNVNTNGYGISSYSAVCCSSIYLSGNGGSITINAGGSISVSTVDSTSTGYGAATGSGGNITLVAGGGSTGITNNGANIQSYALNNSAGASGNGGSITISSGNSVSLGSLFSYSQASGGNSGNGGSVTVTAGTTLTNGGDSINSMSTSSSGVAANGGAVTLVAGGAIGNNSGLYSISSYSGGSTGSGNGGAIKLVSGDTISLIYALESDTQTNSGTTGNGGNVTVLATNAVNIGGPVETFSNATGGNVIIVSTQGTSGTTTLNVSGGIETYAYNQSGASNQGGSVSLVASGDINVGYIIAYAYCPSGVGIAGNVFASSGASDTTPVTLNGVDTTATTGGVAGQVFAGANLPSSSGESGFNMYLALANPVQTPAISYFYQGPGTITGNTTIHVNSSAVDITPGVYTSIGVPGAGGAVALTLDLGGDSRTIVPIVTSGDMYLSSFNGNNTAAGGTSPYQTNNGYNVTLVSSGSTGIVLSGNVTSLPVPATSGTAGDVLIAALGSASITRSGGTVSGNSATFFATGGNVGASGAAIQTNVPTLTAMTVGSGSISIDNGSGPLNISGATAGLLAPATLSISAGGNLTVSGSVAGYTVMLSTDASSNGAIDVNGNIVGLFAVNLSTNGSGGITVESGSNVYSPGSYVYLIANGVTLNGTVQAGNGEVLLIPNGSQNITFLTSPVGGDFNVTQAQLNNITASTLSVGYSTTTGGITSGAINLTGGVGPGYFNLLFDGSSFTSVGNSITVGSYSVSVNVSGTADLGAVNGGTGALMVTAGGNITLHDNINLLGPGGNPVVSLDSTGDGTIVALSNSVIDSSSVFLETNQQTMGAVGTPLVVNATYLSATTNGGTNSSSVYINDLTTGNLNLQNNNVVGSTGTFFLNATNSANTAILSGSSAVQGGTIVLNSVNGSIGSNSGLWTSAFQIAGSASTQFSAQALNGSVFIDSTAPLTFVAGTVASTTYNNIAAVEYAALSNGALLGGPLTAPLVLASSPSVNITTNTSELQLGGSGVVNNLLTSALQLDAATLGTFSVQTGGTVTVAGAITATQLTLTGTDLTISGSINVGSGSLFLVPSGSEAVLFGAASHTPGSFNVTQADLSAITAGTLNVGGVSTGTGLSIAGNVNTTGAGPGAFNLILASAGAITNASGWTIAAPAVSFQTNGSNIGTLSFNVLVNTPTLSATTGGGSNATSVYITDAATSNVTLTGTNGAGATGTFFLSAANTSGAGILTGGAATVRAGTIVLNSVNGNVGALVTPLQIGGAATTNLTADAGNGYVYVNSTTALTLRTTILGSTYTNTALNNFVVQSAGTLATAGGGFGNVTATNGNVLLTATGVAVSPGDTVQAGSSIGLETASVANNGTITPGTGALAIDNSNAGLSSGNISIGLSFGTWNVVHGMSISAVGNVDLKGLFLGTQFPTVGGADLLVVAGGNISASGFGGSGTIDTSSNTGNGGSVSLIAGAAYNFSLSTPSALTVTGASATGGNIDLTSGTSKTAVAITTSSTDAAGGNAGPVTLVAFAPSSGPGTAGTIALDATGLGTVTATAVNGNGGAVLMIAGSTAAGDTLSLGSVSTGAGGSLSLATATPVINPANPGHVVYSSASQSSGTYAPSTQQQGGINAPNQFATIASTSSINLDQLGAIVFHGSSLAILSSGSITDNGNPASIDLSYSAGVGGTLTLLSGYSFTPSTPYTGTINYPPLDQVRTFTITGSTSGNNNNISLGDTTINTSGITGGNVVAAANGSITFNAINSTGTTGAGGTVTVIGTGVAVNGLINTSSSSSAAGAVSITAAIPASLTGLTVKGALIGGSISAATASGSILLASTNVGSLSVTADAGSIQATGTLTCAGLTASTLGSTPTGNVSLVNVSAGSNPVTLTSGPNGSITATGLIQASALTATAGSGGITITNTTAAAITADANLGGAVASVLINDSGASATITGANTAQAYQLNMTTAGAAIVVSPSAFNANSITLSTSGTISFPTSNVLSVQPDASTGAGGTLTIEASNITSWLSAGTMPLTLNASANVATGATGGTIDVVLSGGVAQTLGTAGTQINLISNSGASPTGTALTTGGTVTFTNNAGVAVSTNISNNPVGINVVPLGGNGGNGGTINLTGTTVTAVGGGSLSLNADGVGSGAGGTISVTSTSVLTPVIIGSVAGDIQLSAQSGLTGGNGGSAQLITNSALTVDAAAITINPRGATGTGGSIILSGSSVAAVGGGVLTLSANGPSTGTGNGGFVSVTTTDSAIVIGAGSGDLTLNAQSGSTGGNGGIVEVNAALATVSGGLTFNAGAINVAPQGTNGNGGQILLTGYTIGSSTPGALVTVTSNGKGTGNGGVVSLTTTTTASTMIVGTQPGDFDLIATGGTAKSGTTPASASGNGGMVSFTAAGDLLVNPVGANVNPLGTLGNGGSMSFTAGTNAITGGTLVVNGALTANGIGKTGVGGSITLESNSPFAFNIGLTTALNTNGVLGTLNVKGAPNGSITAINTGGNVTNTIALTTVGIVAFTAGGTGSVVLTKPIGATTSSLITLMATGSGDITESATSALPTAAKIVLAQTGSGPNASIGGGSVALQVKANELSANAANGFVNVNDTATGTIKLDASSAGAGNPFILSGTGNFSLAGDISSTTGAVSLKSAGSITALSPMDEVVAPTITLTAGSLGIGTGTTSATALNFDGTNITANATGLINLLSTGAGAVNLQGSTTAKSFELTAPDTIDVLGSVATTGATTSLIVTGAGNIATSFGGQINGKTVSLTTTNGYIGGASPLQVNALTLTATAVGSGVGSVSIHDVATGAMTLNNSQSATSFTLTTAGPTTLKNILATNGNIVVINGSGLLQTAGGKAATTTLPAVPGAEIAAKNGSITLQDNNTTNGSIVLGLNSSVITGPGASGGFVAISIGPVGSPLPGPTPSTTLVQVNKSGGGNVLYGGNGISAALPAHVLINVINAQGTNVLFNTGLLAGTKIKLSGGVTITADPPVSGAAILPATSGSSLGSPAPMVAAGESPLAAPANVAPIMLPTAASNNVSAAGSSGAGSSVGTANVLPIVASLPVSPSGATVGAANDSSALASLMNAARLQAMTQSALQNQTDDAAVQANEPVWVSETELRSGEIPALLANSEAFGIQAEVTTMANLRDADAGIGLVANPQQATNVSSAKRMSLTKGAVVLAPVTDTVVETPYGTVKVDAQSLVLIIAFAQGVSVYNFDDSHKDAVSVGLQKDQIALRPGMQVLVTRKGVQAFDEVNPAQMFLYRGITSSNFGGAYKAFASEFSVPRAIKAVLPLKQVVHAQNPRARKLADHLLKTTSILIKMDKGVQYEQILRRHEMAFGG